MDKIDLIVSKIEDLKENVDAKLDRYNDLLEEHIKRTDLLEELHKDNAKRIELLEKPKVVANYLRSQFLKIAAVAGGLVGIYKALELFL